MNIIILGIAQPEGYCKNKLRLALLKFIRGQYGKEGNKINRPICIATCMYIIGILIGLYLQISIVFLCLFLVVGFFIVETCYEIIYNNFILKQNYVKRINGYKIKKYIVKDVNKRIKQFVKCNCIQKVKSRKHYKRMLHFILLSFVILGTIQVRTLNINYEEKYSDISDEVNVKGIIISEPQDKDYKYTYTIKVEEINNQDKYKGTKLILNINKNKLKDIVPKFGDEVELTGEFERPNSARNYKGFDYKQYLKSKGIYGTVDLENYKIVAEDQIDNFSKLINSVQNSMKNNINAILGKEEAALCIGILVGDREKISEETEDNFKKSNLTHMLAVSGSHITYIITALAVLLGRTGKKLTKIITILILLFFMALTGFTSSVIRACIMGILVLLASMLHRKSDTINNLGVSSLIILLFNPYAIIDVGFLLSYGGTIGIVLLGDRITNGLYKGENKVIKYIIISFSITLSANLMIIPIMAYNFSTISFTFWISNILAAPVMEIVTIFSFIVYFISIVFPLLAEFLGIFLGFLLDILLKIAEISSLIPGSSIYIKTPYVIECVIYYLIIYVICNLDKVKFIIKGNKQIQKIFKFIIRIRSNSIRNAIEENNISENIVGVNEISTNNKVDISKLGIELICLFTIVVIVFVSIGVNIIQKPLKIYFVDVGQGDCTLIQTPTNKNILIDGGGSEFGNFDVGESILLPYLLDRRVTTIDYMLISHADSDHIAGLFKVIENLRVKNIIISKQDENSENLKILNQLVKEKKIKVTIVEQGDCIQIDKYSYIEILFPEDELIKDNVLNNNSIVAKFNYENFSMLFTGDIEEVAENRICEMYEDTNKLNSTILKVAHHGSKTSSTEEFLELVKPKIAFIGVGANNNFGHPNDEVIERLQEYTKLVYRTDECGEISIVIDKKSRVKVNKYVE